MKTYTLSDIRALRPCYDPSRYLSEDWSGTVLDVLRVTECPPQDRLWVAVHWLDDRTLRLFAVWRARESLSLIPSPDQRSINACNVAERYANGEATQDELDAAGDAAWAAGDAAWAARDAAWAAAWDAARAAAWDAARAAAWDAARAAARDAQINHLISMISDEE